MSIWIFFMSYICVIKFTSTTCCCIAFSVESDRFMWFLNKRKIETAFQGTEPYTSRNTNFNTCFFIISLPRGTSDHFGRRMNSTTSRYSLQFFSYKRFLTLRVLCSQYSSTIPPFLMTSALTSVTTVFASHGNKLIIVHRTRTRFKPFSDHSKLLEEIVICTGVLSGVSSPQLNS